MEKLILNYIGKDSWNRPVYKAENDQLFKDTNCGEGNVALCTVYGGFEGEPDTPIQFIAKYKDIEIEIINNDEEPTREERFSYMMLDRLRMDCEYYLGYGNRNKKHLWSGNEEEHINEMKKIYKSFADNKKPEWLTWEEILNFEKEMIYTELDISGME